MVRLTTLSTALALLVASPLAAQSAGDRFYFQVDGGLALLADNELFGLTTEFAAGYVIGGRIGGRVNDYVRTEIELAYAANDIDTIGGLDLGSVGLNAELSSLSFGAGVYADLLQTGTIVPYVGGGVGGAYKELSTNFSVPEEATDFTVHGEAGVAFDLTPNFAIVPHYRFVWLDNVGDLNQFGHWIRLGIRVTP